MTGLFQALVMLSMSMQLGFVPCTNRQSRCKHSKVSPRPFPWGEPPIWSFCLVGRTWRGIHSSRAQAGTRFCGSSPGCPVRRPGCPSGWWRCLDAMLPFPWGVSATCCSRRPKSCFLWRASAACKENTEQTPFLKSTSAAETVLLFSVLCCQILPLELGGFHMFLFETILFRVRWTRLKINSADVAGALYFFFFPSN